MCRLELFGSVARNEARSDRSVLRRWIAENARMQFLSHTPQQQVGGTEERRVINPITLEHGHADEVLQRRSE